MPLDSELRYLRYGQFDDVTKFVVRGVVSDLGLSDAAIDRLDRDAGALHKALVEATRTSVRRLSSQNQFPLEEMGSGIGYPSEYKVKSILEQIACLKKLFPHMYWGSERCVKSPLPAKTEGRFVIPYYSEYGYVMSQIFEQMQRVFKGKFHSHIWAGYHGTNIYHTDRTSRMIRALDRGQGFNLLPAQFGFLHAGRSTRRVLEVMDDNEFGLDICTVGFMLLTHPERLTSEDDLFIDCPGNVFVRDGQYVCPHYRFQNGQVIVDVSPRNQASELYGSASGFFVEE